jgi:hypothetical protein
VGRFQTALLGTCLLALAGAAPAAASWQAGGPASGYSTADTMPAGETPVASATGRTVTVTWNAVSMSDGGPVGGYLVKRYDASGEARAVGAECAEVVVALSCVEQLVPGGEWRYTVTPLLQGWWGAEGAASTAVTITGRPPPRGPERAAPGPRRGNDMEGGLDAARQVAPAIGANSPAIP